MKILVLVSIAAVVIVVVLVIVGRSRSGSTLHQAKTLEQRLDLFAGCGLRLADPFTPEDLRASWSGLDGSVDAVLVALGGTEEQPPWRNHCVNLWHFDTECIEDHGDYRRIVERMVEMAQGSLPLDNIKDHVDVEKKEAWFSFSFRGAVVKVECKVDDDWVDFAIFAKFVALLGESNPDKVFVYYDLGGQDCIIGCVKRDELRKLNDEGIKFVSLT